MDEKYKDSIEKENYSNILNRFNKTDVKLDNGYLKLRIPEFLNVNNNLTLVGWLTLSPNDCLSIVLAPSTLNSEKIETFCKDSASNLKTEYFSLVFTEKFVIAYDVVTANSRPRQFEIIEKNFSLVFNGTSVISGLKIFKYSLTSKELFKDYTYYKPGYYYFLKY